MDGYAPTAGHPGARSVSGPPAAPPPSNFPSGTYNFPRPISHFVLHLNSSPISPPLPPLTSHFPPSNPGPPGPPIAVRFVELLSRVHQRYVAHPGRALPHSAGRRDSHIASRAPSPHFPSGLASAPPARFVFPPAVSNVSRASFMLSPGFLSSGAFHRGRSLRRPSALWRGFSSLCPSAPADAAQSTGLPDPSYPPCPQSGTVAQLHGSSLRT